MDDAKLEELARSIRANGVIQPIVVRRAPASGAGRDRYQIIAGERRWRAAQRAHLTKVPIVVKDVGAGDKMRLLEMALIENIQREDLNPMEEAAAYQRLVDEFHLKQDDIAAQVGKDRATVANYLRLLKLPAEVRGNVASGALSMGHARAIVALGSEADQRRRRAGRDRARSVGPRNRSAGQGRPRQRRSRDARTKRLPKKDVHTRAAEEQLHLALGTPVEIKRTRQGRHDRDHFHNEDELQRIYEYSDREEIDGRPTNTRTKPADRDGQLRWLSEQTRRRRARSGAERNTSPNRPTHPG